MKFVIQHHICEDAHYDLMIESGEILLSWRISSNDIEPMLEGKKIKVKKIHDHRKEYLTYEGPVSGGRGKVEIFDSGECELIPDENGNSKFYQYKMSGRIITKNIRINNENELFFIKTIVQ